MYLNFKDNIMIDMFKFRKYTDRLDYENNQEGNCTKLIYMWVKQDIISLNEFKELIKYCIENAYE